jgi:hypothetical protein
VTAEFVIRDDVVGFPPPGRILVSTAPSLINGLVVCRGTSISFNLDSGMGPRITAEVLPDSAGCVAEIVEVL